MDAAEKRSVQTGYSDTAEQEEESCKVKLPDCPVEVTLLMIGEKWKILILRDLLNGTQRFGQLKKSIGSISQKVLTAQLRDMEKKGLLIRKVYPEIPPRVEYTLTELGYSLRPIADAMRDWGMAYKKHWKETEKDLAPSEIL